MKNNPFDVLIISEVWLTNKTSDPRGAGSNLGQGGGAASRKRAPYFTLANKQKSLTLKNSLSLLNLYD